ncbi:hypothetical protein G210_4268 [Candida maltosa Xu316]|uniref:Uncharacterized protein n=1 Tax=Candida maltosa (strain Xu316) TaxID=1245528 RepID=M3JRZ1_CANMX|nr:hypothetical protein G210_4268 [Candida maltosa Xu316]
MTKRTNSTTLPISSRSKKLVKNNDSVKESFVNSNEPQYWTIDSDEEESKLIHIYDSDSQPSTPLDISDDSSQREVNPQNSIHSENSKCNIETEFNHIVDRKIRKWIQNNIHQMTLQTNESTTTIEMDETYENSTHVLSLFNLGLLRLTKKSIILHNRKGGANAVFIPEKTLKVTFNHTKILSTEHEELSKIINGYPKILDETNQRLSAKMHRILTIIPKDNAISHRNKQKLRKHIRYIQNKSLKSVKDSVIQKIKVLSEKLKDNEVKYKEDIEMLEYFTQEISYIDTDEESDASSSSPEDDV